MNQENEKLQKVKKSCSIVNKVCIALTIILIVGCVASFIGGIAVIGMGREFDAKLQEAKDAGIVTTDHTTRIGSSSKINIEVFAPANIDTDVPAVREFLDSQPMATFYGMTVIGAGLVLAALAVVMRIVSSAFKIIEEEGSPFTDRVIRRITVTMAIVSILVGITASMAFGALLGVITWALYTILDYGKVLQIQSDETL